MQAEWHPCMGIIVPSSAGTMGCLALVSAETWPCPRAFPLWNGVLCDRTRQNLLGRFQSSRWQNDMPCHVALAMLVGPLAVASVWAQLKCLVGDSESTGLVPESHRGENRHGRA